MSVIFGATPLLVFLLVLSFNGFRKKEVRNERTIPAAAFLPMMLFGLLVGGVTAWWGAHPAGQGYIFRATEGPLYVTVGCLSGAAIGPVWHSNARFDHINTNSFPAVRSYVRQAFVCVLGLSVLQLMAWDYYVQFDGLTLETNGFWDVTSESCAAADIEELVIESHVVVPTGVRKHMPHLLVRCDGTEHDFHTLLADGYKPLLQAIKESRPDLVVKMED